MKEDSIEVPFTKPKSFVETVAEYLRESIISGSLKPGEKINNMEISQKLGVSSIPLREALRILENEGLVISHSGKGSWVSSASRKDLEESFEIREMIEIFAVDLIDRAEKTRRDLDEKLNSIAILEEAKKLGPKFHDYLIKLANNDKLFAMYDMLSNNIRRYQQLSFKIRSKGGFDIVEHVRQHLGIIEKLIDRDFEGAKDKIRAHLETLKNMLLDQIDFSE